MYHVVAQRTIAADLDTVWSFLTRPELLARWFADTPRFAPGEPCRFEFGDGDFFTGTVTEWEPRILLGVTWKFVGLGPTYKVNFSLLRRKSGTEVSIVDRGALTEGEALCLRVGWSEFLMRLEKSIRGGGSSRFEWRREITFTATVTGRTGMALESLGDPSWYRQSLDGVAANPRSGGPDSEVTLDVSCAAWGATRTAVRIRPERVHGSDHLFIYHVGWRDLPPALGEAERCRFAGLWFHALAPFEAATHDRARVP